MKRYVIIRDAENVVTCTVHSRTDLPYDLWRRHSAKYGAYHSPTGFEFGYGGSGPAELARAIVSDFKGKLAAPYVYQQFKAEFIATLPPEGGTLVLEPWEEEPGFALVEVTT